MNVYIIAVGKAGKKPETKLFEHYVKRIGWKVSLKEVELKKKFPSSQQKEKEAELLLEAVPKGALKVVLDEHGKEISSRDFANKIQTWNNQGKSKIAFLIGGADGHGETVLKQADFKLSFGRMVWPHMLVRAMLAEQIFRAKSIIDNHPYHRD